MCDGAGSRNLLKSRISPIQSAQVASLFRYPVKGLTPEPLPRVALGVGETLPADRRYAIENGPSGFDPADPKWMSKAYFLMLMRDEWLAALHTHFDDASNVLTIRRNGAVAAQGDLETAEGRAAIERFFATSHAGAIKGPPKVLSSDGHSFSDVARKVVSIINLGSLAAIENMVDQLAAPTHRLAPDPRSQPRPVGVDGSPGVLVAMPAQVAFGRLRFGDARLLDTAFERLQPLARMIALVGDHDTGLRRDGRESDLAEIARGGLERGASSCLPRRPDGSARPR